MADTTSRLLVKSTTLRETLITRNLYSPDVEYPISPNSTQKVVNAISSVASILTPFKGFSLKNSVFGRLADSSPLTEVSTILLGKQFAFNSMSHLAQQTLPVIRISNLFDKNKNTKLFTKNIDYKITKKQQSKFQNFIDDLVYSYPMKDNPFNNNPINSDYIKNSGTAQLGFLYSAINQNIYKQNDTTLTQYGNIVNNPIQPRSNLLANKIYFDFSNSLSYPYLAKHPNIIAGAIANSNMTQSYINTSANNQEYAPNADFINNNFGTTNKSYKYDSGVKGAYNAWTDLNNEFSDDNIENKLVWGRDGVESETKAKIAQLRGDTDYEVNNFNDVPISAFKIKGGLLEYTRNLLNATEGNIVDITRKAFKDGDKIVGFNGSGLWRANNSTYASDSNISGKKGIRQHTVLDEYNRFAKAIRFNGNIVYGGNENSVIYKSVLPSIHPTIDQRTGTMNKKNMMLSIENLAIRVISKDKYGIIDDEYGTAIPASEVGPFNGRIMWFPPYDMTVNETSTAKYEPTVMIGRNEPIYNYQNSERSATLNFTLLVDYPQHLRNYIGQNKQKEIAEFFAFGGDPYIDEFITTENLEAKQNKLFNEITTIMGQATVSEPNINKPSPISVYFPNNEPKVGAESGYIDRLYRDLYYEIYADRPPISADGTGYGLNKDIFFVTGLTWQDYLGEYLLDNYPSGFSQYDVTRTTDQFGKEAEINKIFKDIYTDEDNRNLYNIEIIGDSSITFEGDWEELEKRRVSVTSDFIEERLVVLFGAGADQLGITISTPPKGEKTPDSNTYAIFEKGTKEERKAIISIVRNSNTPKPKLPPLSEADKNAIIEKEKEIAALQTKIRKLKNNNSNLFIEKDINTEILNGFKSISGNYYQPAFHSQTPEDFHKRLTFLQQCTRQGAAIRSDATIDDNGTLRARNSVFGRQPICILRVGDFFYTKVIIESVNIDYTEATWDTNPEGFGMQPMLAKVTLNMKLIGGQSLKGPIDALQNAVSFNYYANSTFTDTGVYKTPSNAATAQETYINGVLTEEQQKLTTNYNYNNYIGKYKVNDYTKEY